MIDMSDVGADAGDNDNDNGHNCTENMIRMKFSGEFHDRSQYSIDLCTDTKSILQLFVYMTQLKKSLGDDPVVIHTIDSGFSALISIFQAIRSKLQPSVQLSGSIFGPFTPAGYNVQEPSKDKDGNSKAVNPKDVFPSFSGTGMPDFKDIGDMLGKLSDITNKMFNEGKEKGYKSSSPAKPDFDPKKIFEQDKAESPDDADKENKDKKED